jgi:hypothetical protein
MGNHVPAACILSSMYLVIKQATAAAAHAAAELPALPHAFTAGQLRKLQSVQFQHHSLSASIALPLCWLHHS